MSDRDALLSAILAEPDADMPRLLYADWLDEFGDALDRARAELIRVQIELTRMPLHDVAPWNVRRIELRAREKTLLNSHHEAWLAPLREVGEPLRGGEAHGQFRRGFVEVVWMPATWFVSRAEVLFARVPARELRITRTTIEELAEVVDSGYFPRLHALDLSDRRLGDDVARVLTKRSSMAAIRTLRLRGCGLTDVGAYRLADAEFEWLLVELDVQYNTIGRAGEAALRNRFGDALVTSPNQ